MCGKAREWGRSRKPFVLALFLAACGGGGGGTSTPADQGPAPEVAPDQVAFHGLLVDFKSKTPKEGVNLLVLNNDTGEPLDPVKYPQFQSGPGGKIDLLFPRDLPLVAFKAWGKDASGFFDFKESYLFNVPTNSQNKRIYAVERLVYSTALSTCFVVDVDPTTYGHLAGTVYWVNPDGEEEFVGCLRIEVRDAQGTRLEEKKDDEGRGIFAAVRYFNVCNDMPTSPTCSDMTRHLNSRFLIANLPDGKYTVSAVSAKTGETLGQVTVRAFPGGISVANLYLTTDQFPTNPTPDFPECEKHSTCVSQCE